MKHFSQNFTLTSSKQIDFIDITRHVHEIVKTSGIKNGLVSVFSNHTTTAIRVNESCDRLQKDMENFLSDIAPSHKPYKHNETAVDGRGNAHSHLLALLTGGSEIIPVSNGKISLGRWQSVFCVELDGPRPKRDVTVTVIGE